MRQLYLFFLTLFLISGCVASSQTTNATPVQSIFDYDTCAPPCWLGLIPGESTASDVEAILAENQDLIDPESVSISVARLESGDFAIDPDTNEIIRATYNFDVAEPYFDTMGTTSRVLIRDRSVYEINVHANERISLSDVVNDLHQPDIVHLHVRSGGTTWLALIYLDLQMRINFNQPYQACNVMNWVNDMIFFSANYLSSSASHDLTRFSSNTMQATLTAYRLENERDVPLDLWQSWLAGEVDMSCEEAWELLPEPEITPEVEATIEPESRQGD